MFHGKPGSIGEMTLESPDGSMKYGNVTYVRFMYPCDNMCRQIPDPSQCGWECKYADLPSIFTELQVIPSLAMHVQAMNETKHKPKLNKTPMSSRIQTTVQDGNSRKIEK